MRYKGKAGDVLFVVFTERIETIRPISVRFVTRIGRNS